MCLTPTSFSALCIQMANCSVDSAHWENSGMAVLFTFILVHHRLIFWCYIYKCVTLLCQQFWVQALLYFFSSFRHRVAVLWCPFFSATKTMCYVQLLLLKFVLVYFSWWSWQQMFSQGSIWFTSGLGWQIEWKTHTPEGRSTLLCQSCFWSAESYTAYGVMLNTFYCANITLVQWSTLVLCSVLEFFFSF